MTVAIDRSTTSPGRLVVISLLSTAVQIEYGVWRIASANPDTFRPKESPVGNGIFLFLMLLMLPTAFATATVPMLPFVLRRRNLSLLGVAVVSGVCLGGLNALSKTLVTESLDSQLMWNLLGGAVQIGLGGLMWAAAVDYFWRRPFFDRLAFRDRLIEPIPGSRCRLALSFLYSEKTMTRVFEPALADMQNEWLTATVAGRKWKARWARVRGYLSLCMTVWSHGLVSIVKNAIELYKGLGA